MLAAMEPSALLDLAAITDAQLGVRHFRVEERISQLFAIEVLAVSPRADLDLEMMVGYGAALRLAAAGGGYRVWGGLCTDAEHVGTGVDGVASYRLQIRPMLWRTSQRMSRRVFQNQNAIEVATSVLREWGIEPVVGMQRRALNRHEYRVQLDESDYAFVARQLEEQGISYVFEHIPPPPEAAHHIASMTLILSDQLECWRERPEALVNAGTTQGRPAFPFVSNVRLGRAVRPGRVSLRGYDYRSHAQLTLAAEARGGNEAELGYERYRYLPKAFVTDAGADQRAGMAAAQVLLDAERSAARLVSMSSNVIDMPPGTRFRIDTHERESLCDDAGLLLVGATIEGDVNGEWAVALEAIPIADALAAETAAVFCPAQVTPKPRVMGLQSAVVVGPVGEEIHTDEFGRVKVQFHWDRLGRSDGASSCWIRVSQSWAGGGYGASQLPRVGHEVIVGFF
ncbi:MAG TPA: type VI secretion system tip protein VgrG, partial [Sorangium sp.]|nr:type VI secretion system tip protein VgrG [Sorangium sp.]